MIEHRPMETDDSKTSVSERKKRPIDSDAESSAYKKPNSGDVAPYYLKILIPQGAAGAIIGKGGETIGNMQKECGARVKMAKNNDFYPGTQERVCLISGSFGAVREMVGFFIEKIREKPDPARKSDQYDYKNTERAKELKLLVTNTTAGMIIGKNGSYIKEIKEMTGTYVQISPKPSDVRLTERVLTAVGEEEQLLAAVELILGKLVNDATAAQHTNVSYFDGGPTTNTNGNDDYMTKSFRSNGADIISPLRSTQMHDPSYLRSSSGGSFSPRVTGSGNTPTFSFASMPVLPPPPTVSSATMMSFGANMFAPPPSFTSTPMGGSTALPFMNAATQQAPPTVDASFSNAPSSTPLLQLLDSMHNSLRGAGYNELALAEIMAAVQTLAKYNVLNLALSGYATSPQQQALPPPQQPPPPQQIPAPVSYIQQTLPPPPMPASGQLPPPTWQFPRPIAFDAPMPNGAEMDMANSYVKFRMTDGFDESEEKLDIEVHENIVGAVLGKQGRSLIEIQNKSRAKVEVSKKGMFVPGTQNRVVSVSGARAAVEQARVMIEQRIKEEQSRREVRNAQARN